MGVYTALSSVCQAVLSVCRAILSVYRFFCVFIGLL